MRRNYKIHVLSARQVISFATVKENSVTFELSRASTRRCLLPGNDQQEDNALFYQIMKVLGKEPGDTAVVTELEDVIFYMDFTRIFDLTQSPMALERQQKAEALFRPEGILLDFGTGPHRYLAFERSGSMSRQARLSFLREDVYEEVKRRILLDLDIGRCQLSKLYAYNGLMLSGGVRIDGLELWKPHRIIVVDNPRLMTNARVITVKGTGAAGLYRHYEWEETQKEIEVTRYDGEGLISKQFSARVDKAAWGEHIHHSFQVRLPFVKGMLHQVDFKDFLRSAGCTVLTDLWGNDHPVDEVEILLTRSMFKGYGWLTENGKGWEDYLRALRDYDHALYITGVGKPKAEKYTELNYQFLNTLQMSAEEFRPADLPLGWDHSPAEEERRWITKATEQRYYELRADPAARLAYFTDKNDIAARVLKKNPLFLHEEKFIKELDAQAEHILSEYEHGRLLVEGDNRYLSGDLLEFLSFLLENTVPQTHNHRVAFSVFSNPQFVRSSYYAPGAVYDQSGNATLLRNPHIARNEELQLQAYREKNQARKHYLGHLTDVVMVDAEMLAAERLGGADYDGDMVKTIADPLLNECVRRHYDFDSLENSSNLPLLYIPSEEPVIRDARNWHDRFLTVRDTFSSRVGVICNAAFDRSVIAYDENSEAEERERYRRETETLAILTGLEIDSAKSGVKPDLSPYMDTRPPRSGFLKYKAILDDDGDRLWYEPTRLQRKKKLIEETDWTEVSSNLERLPYYAFLLKKHTKKAKRRTVTDEELFRFAKPGWKEKLDQEKLEGIRYLVQQYEACTSRIRACRAPIRTRKRQSGIDRILFARGQENEIDPERLYAACVEISPERIGRIRAAITEQDWPYMHQEQRLDFLADQVPELEDFFSLLADFRQGGYRILGDVICDIDEENQAQERKRLLRETDPPVFQEMMGAFQNKADFQRYEEPAAEVFRAEVKKIMPLQEAVKYVVALDKRKLLWELLPNEIEKNAARRKNDDQ